MNWVTSHPYLSSIVFALFVVILGASVVVPKTATNPLEYQPSTWSGAGGISATPVANSQPQQPTNNPVMSNTTVVPYRYVSPFATSDGKATASSEEGMDLSEFEKILTRTSTKDPSIKTSDVGNAYEFIPNGMISLPDLTPDDTPAQAELRSFGNDIGSIIQSFEQSNPNQVAVLKNFMEDRNGADKIEGMKNLGAEMRNVGTLISQTEPTPKQMKAAAADLAAHYDALGKFLAAIPDAKGEDNLYDAIIAYNQSAERFVTSIVNFALIFQASGVVFSQDEAGSVFMFQQGVSL